MKYVHSAQASTGGDEEVGRCLGTASCPLPPEAFPEVIIVSDRRHHICYLCLTHDNIIVINVFIIIKIPPEAFPEVIIVIIAIIVMIIIDIMIMLIMLIRSTTPWWVDREVSTASGWATGLDHSMHVLSFLHLNIYIFSFFFTLSLLVSIHPELTDFDPIIIEGNLF